VQALTIDNMLHESLMADHKIAALGRVPLFEHLTKKELDFIAREGDEVDVPAGKVLIREGRPGDTFYVILVGEAEVLIGGKRRRVLRAGDFFGEISMIDRGLGTATVTTVKPARMFVMSHAQFRDAIKGSDTLLIKVLLAMGQRLRADLALKG
jgi:CRP-like cAMP-binding protein